MLKRHNAFFIAEHMLSLYILSIGVVTLGGIVIFGQQRLHQEAQRLHRYMLAEQLALEVAPTQLTSDKLQIKQQPGTIDILWPDQQRIQCYVQD